ncbi:MAG: hypothetical protein LVS60_16130 [Nodosilinea sp. LVE1205-7]
MSCGFGQNADDWLDRSLFRLGRRSDWPPLRYGALVLLNAVDVLSQGDRGGVDRDGELPARGLGQAPEQGNGEDRFFSGREAVFGEQFAILVVELNAPTGITA